MSILRLSPVLLGLGVSGCFIPSVAVTPRASFAELDGNFAAGSGGATTSSSFEQLGLDDSTTAFSPRVDLEWLGAHVSVSTLQVSVDGSGTASGEIDLGGVAVGADEAVDSSFDLSTFSGAATWDIIPLPIPGLDLDFGLGVGLTLFDFDVELDGEDGGSAQTDESVPIPVIAARVGAEAGPLDIGAVVGFMSVEIDDVDATFLDADLHVAYRLLGSGDRFVGHIVGGYRLVDLEAEYDDGSSKVDTDFSVAGPYLGVMFSF